MVGIDTGLPLFMGGNDCQVNWLVKSNKPQTYNNDSSLIIIRGVATPDSFFQFKHLGRVAGTGRRLGRDVDSTRQLGSLDSSERNYRVVRRPAITRRDVPTSQSMGVEVTDALLMCGSSI